MVSRDFSSPILVTRWLLICFLSFRFYSMCDFHSSIEFVVWVCRCVNLFTVCVYCLSLLIAFASSFRRLPIQSVTESVCQLLLILFVDSIRFSFSNQFAGLGQLPLLIAFILFVWFVHLCLRLSLFIAISSLVLVCSVCDHVCHFVFFHRCFLILFNSLPNYQYLKYINQLPLCYKS